jgi:ammonia channel protein AmtB
VVCSGALSLPPFLHLFYLFIYLFLLTLRHACRSKNTLSFITQIFSGIVALGFLWDIFGYSLVFGTDHGGVIGTLHFFPSSSSSSSTVSVSA